MAVGVDWGRPILQRPTDGWPRETPAGLRQQKASASHKHEASRRSIPVPLRGHASVALVRLRRNKVIPSPPPTERLQPHRPGAPPSPGKLFRGWHDWEHDRAAPHPPPGPEPAAQTSRRQHRTTAQALALEGGAEDWASREADKTSAFAASCTAANWSSNLSPPTPLASAHVLYTAEDSLLARKRRRLGAGGASSQKTSASALESPSSIDCIKFAASSSAANWSSKSSSPTPLSSAHVPFTAEVSLLARKRRWSGAGCASSALSGLMCTAILARPS